MSALSQVFNVTVDTYNTAPDLVVPFVPDAYLFRMEQGSDAFFSFDGKNDMGKVETASPGRDMRIKAQKVWLRRTSGTTSVRVSVNTDV